jgi:uncharacterized protein (TIGR00159 family)
MMRADSELGLLTEIGLSGIVDLFLMSLFVYTLLVWFKRTRAAFVLTGIIIIGFVYLLARQLNLLLTASVLQAFFAVILVAIIVIFQEELRHFFEQVAIWSLNPSLRKHPTLSQDRTVEILVRTLTDLAKARVGALVVIRGKDPIVRHLDGGVTLNGDLSEPLLKSLFDPHSIGHDGAVTVEGEHVTQFSCHLPLSKNFKKLQRTGMRHAAALGLSELTDALCLVASEEQATVSVSRYGQLQEVHEPELLHTILTDFFREVRPEQARSSWKDFVTQNSRQKALAIILTLALWFVLVHESRIMQTTVHVPIEYTAPAASLVVTQITPLVIEVTLSGPRRAFYFLKGHQPRLLLKLLSLEAGTRHIGLSPSNFTFPKEISIDSIEPRHVTVRIESRAQAAEPSRR